MNPNNQKENPAGLKNRNDQLSQDREAQAEQARRAKLAAMTGPELMEHIKQNNDALNAADNVARLSWWNEETYIHCHGDSLKSMLEEDAHFYTDTQTPNT